MKLLVKSRLPSFPPVPRSDGHSGLPPSSRTTAADSHSAWGPRHSRRQSGISVALSDLKRRSAAASKRLYPVLALRASASARCGGLSDAWTSDLIVAMACSISARFSGTRSGLAPWVCR